MRFLFLFFASLIYMLCDVYIAVRAVYTDHVVNNKQWTS